MMIDNRHSKGLKAKSRIPEEIRAQTNFPIFKYFVDLNEFLFCHHNCISLYIPLASGSDSFTSEGVEYLVMNLVDLFVRTPEEKRTFVWSRRSGRVTDQDKKVRRRPLTSPTTDAFYANTGMQARDGPLSALRDKKHIDSVALQ